LLGFGFDVQLLFPVQRFSSLERFGFQSMAIHFAQENS